MRRGRDPVTDADRALRCEDLLACMKAVTANATGVLFATRGNGAIRHAGSAAASFIERRLLDGTHSLLDCELGADYQSGFEIGNLASVLRRTEVHHRLASQCRASCPHSSVVEGRCGGICAFSLGPNARSAGLFPGLRDPRAPTRVIHGRCKLEPAGRHPLNELA